MLRKPWLLWSNHLGNQKPSLCSISRHLPTEMVAHDLSDASIGGTILLDGQYFRDAYGRVLLLRGVNVGGASKLYVSISNIETI